MNLQLKGIKLSLFIHSAMFVAFALLSLNVGQARKRVVIDFSLINSKAGIGKPEKKAVVAQKVIKKRVARKPAPKRAKTIPVPPPRMDPIQEAPEPAVEETDKIPMDDPQPMAEIQEDSALEGGSAAGPGVPGRDFIYIRELVQENISYPQIARRMGLEGRVTISFVICSNGTVKEIEIVESSGSPILDKNAVEAVKKTSPFPHHQLEAKVIIPIQYTLH